MSHPFRTTRSSLTFIAPFALPGFDEPLPAGVYALDTEDEAIEGNVRTVFRRVATTLVVESGGRTEHHPVQPDDLEAALRRDREAGNRLMEAMTNEGAPSHPAPKRRWMPKWLRASPTPSDEKRHFLGQTPA